jgi:hypothetical protein
VQAVLEGRTAMDPAIRTVEIANTLSVGERRSRIRQPELRRWPVSTVRCKSVSHGRDQDF